jgi:hypothetical protein
LIVDLISVKRSSTNIINGDCSKLIIIYFKSKIFLHFRKDCGNFLREKGSIASSALALVDKTILLASLALLATMTSLVLSALTASTASTASTGTMASTTSTASTASTA